MSSAKVLAKFQNLNFWQFFKILNLTLSCFDLGSGGGCVCVCISGVLVVLLFLVGFPIGVGGGKVSGFSTCFTVRYPNGLVFFSHNFGIHMGPNFSLGWHTPTHFQSKNPPLQKIKWSWDHIIFNMGIPITGKDSLYIEMGPWFLETRLLSRLFV